MVTSNNCFAEQKILSNIKFNMGVWWNWQTPGTSPSKACGLVIVCCPMRIRVEPHMGNHVSGAG